MSLSANRRSQTAPDNFIVIGNPSSRRIALFQAALSKQGLPAAHIVTYADLLAGRASLTNFVKARSVVRIESPGKDFEVERLLIALGADVADENAFFSRISRHSAEQLSFDKGLILYPRQWYLGLCEALHIIENQLSDCPPHQLMNTPENIKVMFDKPACHARLERQGITVPPSLGTVHSFEELYARIKSTNCHRVFLKLAHGSSASGAVAYRYSNGRHQAITTVEMARHKDELRLYNSRRIRTYKDIDQIATLIDSVCQHRVHVERWLPKANIDGYTFDLRLVVIAGHAMHTVVRKSRTPMTNLHLLNERDDPKGVAAKMGPDLWAAARHTCERAARCFPDNLHAGIDLLITPDYRRHAILEVNAFGDLLPGILYNGLDTYSAEIVTMRQ
jgi:hypothetical protein